MVPAVEEVSQPEINRAGVIPIGRRPGCYVDLFVPAGADLDGLTDDLAIQGWTLLERAPFGPGSLLRYAAPDTEQEAVIRAKRIARLVAAEWRLAAWSWQSSAYPDENGEPTVTILHAAQLGLHVAELLGPEHGARCAVRAAIVVGEMAAGADGADEGAVLAVAAAGAWDQAAATIGGR